MISKLNTYFMNKKILSFFAHPDDETLAAGATFKKLSSLGCDISVAIPNTGISSRKELTKQQKISLLEQLKIDTLYALSKLGINKDDIFFGEFTDNAIDKHCLLDLIHWIESIIKKVNPDIIFTHHRFCTNIDHQYCHQALIVAARPEIKSHIDVFCGEVPSSTGYLKPTNWDPNLFIEVSKEELDAKIDSMISFKSEARPDPHPRSPEVLRALAKVRGSESGYNYAEAFMVNKIFL